MNVLYIPLYKDTLPVLEQLLVRTHERKCNGKRMYEKGTSFICNVGIGKYKQGQKADLLLYVRSRVEFGLTTGVGSPSVGEACIMPLDSESLPRQPAYYEHAVRKECVPPQARLWTAILQGHVF